VDYVNLRHHDRHDREPRTGGQNAMTDAAQNSQALRDSVRAGSELLEAQEAGASATILAELVKARSSADARVDSLRRRVG
jgi:hypothetical protein